MIVFHPSPNKKCVNISGLNISDREVIESKFGFIGERATGIKIVEVVEHELK